MVRSAPVRRDPAVAMKNKKPAPVGNREAGYDGKLDAGHHAPKSSYRASTIKRHRRTAGQTEQLDRQIIAVLKEDHPQSVRHVFYRMTNPRLPEPVEKSDRGYRHVQARCVALRRSGRVAYGWFADLSRRGYFVNTFSGAADFIDRMKGLYRADLWQEADCRVEVWAESRSIASVILGDCNQMAVSLFPCGGFSSLSFIHEACAQHNASDDARPLQIFYVGDFDAAGVLIDASLQREMREHLDDDIDLRFERIGINLDQIEEFDLPTKPRKEGERRSPHIKFSVEAEAMPSSILRGILREKVEALLPRHALETARVAEQSERDYLTRVAAIVGEGDVR